MNAVVFSGIILLLIGGMGTLIAAFKTGLLWGLGCIVCLPVTLLFLIIHWDVAKNPFFLQILGLLIALLGASYS